MRLLILIAVAMSCCIAVAQEPPVKLGLWEKELISTDRTGAPLTMKSKSCITAEDWQRMTQNAEKPHPDCTMKNVKTAHGYTFDGTCTMPGGGSVVINGSSTIQDPTHIVAESHSTMTLRGQTRQRDIHSSSHFVGADCGSVKPGDPEMEN